MKAQRAAERCHRAVRVALAAAYAVAARGAAPEPKALPPATAFAGAKACADCHPKNFEAWSKDWHARALAKAAPGTVKGDFGGVHFKGASSEAWMERKDGGFVTRTADRDGTVRAFPVDWVLGGKRMQDPVTVLDDGRWQVLPVYWHVTGKGEWTDYNESKQGAVGPDHPFFWTNFRRNANHECLECHETGVHVDYDRKTHRIATTFADAGIACESCHGPGARHAASIEIRDIVQPRKVSPELGLAICARCHGAHQPLYSVLDPALQFRPGRPYGERFESVMVTDGPLLSPDFFADGRPKSSTYELQALVQSACYKKGGATCLSCHTPPHGDHGDDELAVPKDGSDPGDATCRPCHASIFASTAAHTHHRAAEAQRCVACHMPRIVPSVLDRFADHSLDVPVPENTARHGVPNACGTCHADRSPDALAKSLHEWWPKAEARQRRRLRLADAIDQEKKAASEEPLRAVMADRAEAPDLRGAAAMLLALRFPRSAQASIAPLLTDGDPRVRARAILALQQAPIESAGALLRPLLADTDLEVRLAAASVLIADDDPKAEATLRAMENDPATEALLVPHTELGLLEARRGKLDLAEAQLSRAVELQFWNAFALVRLGDLHAIERKWETARADFEEALRFDPQNAEARRRIQLLASEGH